MVVTPNTPVADGTTVRVHVNLHRQRQGLPHFAVSIGGKVQHYRATVCLTDCTAVILEGGWKQCQKLGKRRVYAYLQGTLAADDGTTATATVHLNPNRGRNFTVGRDGPTWSGSPFVRCVDGVIEVAGGAN